MSESQTIARKMITGRRKSASARVRITPGEGKITVNGEELEVYFPRKTWQISLLRPLDLLSLVGKYDIFATARGGGKSGQCDAVRLGLARALSKENPEWRPMLKKADLLRRDARVRERKKYGQPGARKRFQFSKR